MIKRVEADGLILGIIISANFNEEGIHFFTPNNFSQQLAFMNHPTGYLIKPHKHNLLRREVEYTQEVLVIKKGRLRVDFYDVRNQFFESFILGAGDVVLLANGGHGFEVIEQVEMFEIKQGPYAGDVDKTRFSSSIRSAERE